MDIILKLYKAPQITSKHTQETTFASRITLPILRHWHQGSKNPWPDGPGSPKTYTGQVDWLANGQSGPASAYEKIMFSLPLAYNLAAWHKHFPTVPIGQWTEKKNCWDTFLVALCCFCPPICSLCQSFIIRELDRHTHSDSDSDPGEVQIKCYSRLMSVV